MNVLTVEFDGPADRHQYITRKNAVTFKISRILFGILRFDLGRNLKPPRSCMAVKHCRPCPLSKRRDGDDELRRVRYEVQSGNTEKVNPVRSGRFPKNIYPLTFTSAPMHTATDCVHEVEIDR